MKVRLPKEYSQLSKHSQKMIGKAKADEITEELVWTQKMMLQGWCIILNQKPFRFGRLRLTLALGGWRELYRILCKFETRAEQKEYLDTETARIFRKHGFPYEFIEKLEDM